MSKKLLLVVCALTMIAMIGVGSTLAYYTSSVDTTNVVTTGTIAIEINNPQQFDVGLPVMPGETFSQELSIKNTSSVDAYVRLKLDKRWLTASSAPAAGIDVSYIQLNLEANSGWNLAPDGFYYYNTPLAPGQTTPSLYKSVTVSKDADNSYKQYSGNISIDAHAVQARNFTPEIQGGNIVSWNGITVGA